MANPASAIAQRRERIRQRLKAIDLPGAGYHQFAPYLMPRTSSVLHVGAFPGKCALTLRNQYPEARLVLLEPDKENYVQLPQCGAEAHPWALAAGSGPTLFHHRAHRTASSMFPDTVHVPEVSYEVRGVTLEEVHDITGRAPIDLMLLNCEGAEMYVVETILSDTAWPARIGQLSIAFHPGPATYSVDCMRYMLRGLRKHYTPCRHPVASHWFLFLRR